MSRLRGPRTLRARVGLLAAAATLLVLALAGLVVVSVTRSALVEGLDDNIDVQAGIVRDRVAAGEPVTVDDLVSDDVVVQFTGADGAVRTVPGDAPQLPQLGDSGATTVDVADAVLRVHEFEVDGTTVQVAGNLEDVTDGTGAVVRALAYAAPLAAVALAAVVWEALGRALRPVERIRARVDDISASALDRRVPEPGTPLEVDQLARTMNAMLGRLERAAEEQRRFVADASHELRSPLARMRAELEVDAAHPASADPAATAGSVLSETVGLQRLVDDLLLLARYDAGALRPGAALLDLDEVVSTAVDRRRARDGVVVDASAVRPVQVRGDRDQLERLVGNLVDNAVRHARSRVTVSLDEEGSGAVLTVADDGPGIAQADRERVFERFTRLDAARSSRDGGAGLGLPIARDIAVRHRGALVVRDGAGGGAAFVVTLPRDPGVAERHPG